MEESITIELSGRPLTISTGALAKQADGSVVVRYGDTVVLVTGDTDLHFFWLRLHHAYLPARAVRAKWFQIKIQRTTVLVKSEIKRTNEGKSS